MAINRTKVDAIKAELVNNPAGIAYPAIAPENAAAIWEKLGGNKKLAPDRPAPVAAEDVLEHAIATGLWLAIEAAAADPADPRCPLARTVKLAFSSGRFATFNMAGATVQTMLATLKTAGLVDDAAIAAFVALGANRRYRWEEIGMAERPFLDGEVPTAISEILAEG